MSSLLLKLIALFAMTLDHFATYLPGLSFPIFNVIGRIAGPLFLFCFSNSMQFTSNRRKLLFRIYIASFITSIGNFALILLYKTNAFVLGNFFPTLFTIGITIVLWERKYSSQKKKIITLVGFWIVQNIIGVLVLLPFLSSFVQGVDLNFTTSKLLALTGVFPNYITCESGIIWVALGLLFYKYRDSKSRQIIVLGVYSILMMSLHIVAEIMNYDVMRYEWVSFFACAFIYFFNSKKGKPKLKYLFYVYYPAHIWGLYSIGNHLFN